MGNALGFLRRRPRKPDSGGGRGGASQQQQQQGAGAPPPPVGYVFLSYAHDDPVDFGGFLPDMIANELRVERYQVVVADRETDAQAKAPFHGVMPQGVGSSSSSPVPCVFVALLSTAYAESPWCMRELAWALDKFPTLTLPVLCDSPEELRALASPEGGGAAFKAAAVQQAQQAQQPAKGRPGREDEKKLAAKTDEMAKTFLRACDLKPQVLWSGRQGTSAAVRVVKDQVVKWATPQAVASMAEAYKKAAEAMKFIAFVQWHFRRKGWGYPWCAVSPVSPRGVQPQPAATAAEEVPWKAKLAACLDVVDSFWDDVAAKRERGLLPPTFPGQGWRRRWGNYRALCEPWYIAQTYRVQVTPGKLDARARDAPGSGYTAPKGGVRPKRYTMFDPPVWQEDDGAVPDSTVWAKAIDEKLYVVGGTTRAELDLSKTNPLGPPPAA